MIGSGRKRLLIALAFLLPNLVGFLLFTAGPVFFSLYMSFTDWTLTRHNTFSDEPVRFVGIENYARLLAGDESVFFWDYFWNTVYLMIGIPLSIFGSLALALMVNAKSTPERPKSKLMLSAIGVGVTILACWGAWILATPAESLQNVASLESGLTDLSKYEVAELRRNGLVTFIALVGVVISAGLGIGQMFFRAAFYLPTLLAGVAMFLLWKTLYRPRGGLINAILQPVLDMLESLVVATPPWLWYGLGIVLALVTLVWTVKLFVSGVAKYRDGDTGPASLGARFIFGASACAALLGISLVLVQLPERSLLPTGYNELTSAQSQAALDAVDDQLASEAGFDRDEFAVARAELEEGGAYRDIVARLVGVAGDRFAPRIEDIVQREADVSHEGFVAGEQGLTAPEWLISSTWAKPALIIMGVWLAIGGANMLLYLAGLSNIPPELYEAAAIDGATGWQRFIHVTWPQLAPTTFFIVIMSTIGGLQGGFEQALVMTNGQADTIVLTYYLYNLAFNGNFQLGLASAVAWIMFAMIFLMTAVNFRFGSRMTNE